MKIPKPVSVYTTRELEKPERKKDSKGNSIFFCYMVLSIAIGAKDLPHEPQKAS